MSTISATQQGVVLNLLSAVTTGTSPSVVIPSTKKNPVIQVTGSGTITGGTIILEEAFDPAYAGTWSQLASITASTLTGGVIQNYHFLGSLVAVRARISSDITGGGKISVDIIGA